jgi:hypothetical protein
LLRYFVTSLSFPRVSACPASTDGNTASPSESALTKKQHVTRLESALTNSLDLKVFRIRSYKKKRGEGGEWLTSERRTKSRSIRTPDRREMAISTGRRGTLPTLEGSAFYIFLQSFAMA